MRLFKLKDTLLGKFADNNNTHIIITILIISEIIVMLIMIIIIVIMVLMTWWAFNLFLCSVLYFLFCHTRATKQNKVLAIRS